MHTVGDSPLTVVFGKRFHLPNSHTFLPDIVCKEKKNKKDFFHYKIQYGLIILQAYYSVGIFIKLKYAYII